MNLSVDPLKNQVTILTDIPDWARTTVEALENLDWEVELIDIRSFDWTASEQLPDWGLVFNRIAARPADDERALLTKACDLLATVEVGDIPCLNRAGCHTIGVSKFLQASLLARIGLPTPWTQPVTPGDWQEKLAQVDADMSVLIKPDAGGRGRGISSPEDVGPETFAPDGRAVLQERIESGDGRIHRVEMLGGEILYEATAPLATERFDYCLAGAEEDSLTFTTELSEETVSACQRIAESALLDLGSIEYLIDEEGRLWFIDINPVSSYVPNVKERLGFDPFEKISELLQILRAR